MDEQAILDRIEELRGEIDDIDGQVLFAGPAEEGEILPVFIDSTEDGLLYGRIQEG